MNPHPITDLTDFFPFNIESGPGFVLLYAAIVLGGYSLAGWVRRQVARRIENVPIEEELSAPDAATGYRNAPPTPAKADDTAKAPNL